VGSNPPDSATVYYDDGTISVSGRIILVGAPFNQTYNLASIVGIAHGKDKRGQLVSLMWTILSVFGLLFGISCITTDSPILGGTIFLGSAAILWKTIKSSSRPYVELKFGGLNNQMLFMRKMEQAEHLAASINMAIQDMHTPPEPGQPVQTPPIFPSPVFSRN
jgi:hypothetical protein